MHRANSLKIPVLLLGLSLGVFLSSPAISSVSFRAQAHLEGLGWQGWIEPHEILGTEGQGRRMEAIRIELIDAPEGMQVTYRAHVAGQGWLPWVFDGQPSGTTGIEAAIQAIEIKLEGKTKGHHVRYQGHVQGIGWMGWVQDGETSGTTGRNLRLEALRLEITKGDQPTAPGVDGLRQVQGGPVSSKTARSPAPPVRPCRSKR
jgi:uncharacterized protein YjdB